MVILITVVVATILVSALCSLFEAVVLSTRVSAIEAGQRKGRNQKLAAKMIEMKRKVAVPIAAILILNTVANTAGATIAGMYANTVMGPSWVLLFSILFTLAILFIAEIIPKTLGALQWRSIWPFVVYPLTAMTYATYPLIAVTQRVTDWLTPSGKHPQVTEDEILSFIRLGARTGEISDWEGQVVHNVLQLENVAVNTVMTPRTVMFSVSAEESPASALAAASEAGFTRVPVYRGDKEDIAGYVVLAELVVAAGADKPAGDLSGLIKPIGRVDEDDDCLSTLLSFLRGRRHIAAVEDPFGGVAGLVTLEDLLETMLGDEIVDERDVEVDMRKLARKKRKERRDRDAPAD